jgi:hypothetical protein
MMTLTDRPYANRKVFLFLFLALVVLASGLPGNTRAITILPATNGLQTFFWAICENGFTSGPWPDIGTALNTGGVQCNPFGGIALQARDASAGPRRVAPLGDPAAEA